MMGWMSCVSERMCLLKEAVAHIWSDLTLTDKIVLEFNLLHLIISFLRS